MKIIMQVKHLAQFANPKDRPLNALDLSNKILINQGLVAFFRGNNALIYKLVFQHGFKFMLYENVFQNLQENSQSSSLISVLLASSFTSLASTLLTYPLDLAHGRMAADMSKKPSPIIDKNQQAYRVKLYTSVRDCLTKTQNEAGVVQSKKVYNLYKGLPSALAAQIPYTVLLISSFELLHYQLDSPYVKFNSNSDDVGFLTKFLTRFGASTLSLLFAQAICYPLDTVKRRMQLNGALGHRNIYRNDFDCIQRIYKEEGISRGLYSGFSINLVKNVPMVFLQYIMFQNLRFISKKKQLRKRE